MNTEKKAYVPMYDSFDDAINKAMKMLREAETAWINYDNLNEKYMRLRSRAESGRISKYGNPLGVRVNCSLSSNNDDILADVVDMSKQTLALYTVLQIAIYNVNTLIKKAVPVDSREYVALKSRYLTFPSVPFNKIQHDGIRSKSSAQRAYERGVASVAEYLLEHPDYEPAVA